jgi:hypothetical protein
MIDAIVTWFFSFSAVLFGVSTWVNYRNDDVEAFRFSAILCCQFLVLAKLWGMSS